MRRFRLVPLAALVPVLALVGSSCRSPTELVLEIYTNVPCTETAEWKGVAVYAGQPGASLEKKWPTLVTTACDLDGYVGSLVVTPSDEKDARVGVRVVAGLSRNPEECEEAGYAGCIVARRSVRFLPHDSSELVVELLTECTNQGCDPDHTCLGGRCVDAATVDETPAVESIPPSEPGVRCGDDGVRCATSGDVCCLTVDVSQGRAQGQCRPSLDCPTGDIVLACDDDTDCQYPNEAEGFRACFLQYKYDLEITQTDTHAYYKPIAISGAQCLPVDERRGGRELTLCQERKPCRDLFACIPSQGLEDRNLLPNYFWCEFSLGTEP